MDKTAKPRKAFTLIELLTILAIPGVLAATGVALTGLASRKSKEHRVRSELNQLITAIESYKAHFGFYPPDNPKNSVTNQLYYELTGTVFVGNGFKAEEEAEQVSQEAIRRLFNANTFFNSARREEELKRFVDLKPGQYHIIYTNPILAVLTVPLGWPTNQSKYPPPFAFPVGHVNPWRYVSSHPLHNPRSHLTYGLRSFLEKRFRSSATGQNEITTPGVSSLLIMARLRMGNRRARSCVDRTPGKTPLCSTLGIRGQFGTTGYGVCLNMW